jgi:hypothetical protein
MIIMLASPMAKTTDKYYKDDKDQNELIRQWKVLIEDIEIINQSGKIMSPFVRFTIGGDYHVRLPLLIINLEIRSRSKNW